MLHYSGCITSAHRVMKIGRVGIRELTRDIQCKRASVLAVFENCKDISPQHILFLTVCVCIKPDVCIEDVSCAYKCGGRIGYGNSTVMDNLFSRFKIFRLHAAFHDASGFMKSHYNVGPGYCYVWPRIPNCFVAGHLSGFIYWLFVKVLNPIMYNSLTV